MRSCTFTKSRLLFCAKGRIGRKLGKTLDFYTPMWYNIYVRQRGNPEKKGSEEMSEGMTNSQLNAYLETLAKLIESKAKTVEEAAEIIRKAKTE